jgi:hypothetical protein
VAALRVIRRGHRLPDDLPYEVVEAGGDPVEPPIVYVVTTAAAEAALPDVERRLQRGESVAIRVAHPELLASPVFARLATHEHAQAITVEVE